MPRLVMGIIFTWKFKDDIVMKFSQIVLKGIYGESKENLLSDLRVSLSLPTVWINSLVLIRQELGLYNVLSSVFLLHGFPLVS